MKIVAMYLPQYHEIEENNRWWGDGYTEWSAVKNAKKLFKKHEQPKFPLDGRYYDLSEESARTWRWQAELAEEYGIYAFCIYHYWFKKGKQLLEKPMEILRCHPEIHIRYFVCWANESWTRIWYGLEREILMEQEYGEREEWENHYRYLRKFFADERYEKMEGKPVIAIYHTADIESLNGMMECWNELAQKDGYEGVYIISGNTSGKIETRTAAVDAFYNFEPGYTLMHHLSGAEKIGRKIKIGLKTICNRVTGSQIIERVEDTRRIYRDMKLDRERDGKKIYLGTFPMWDNTPRRSYKGLYFTHSSPELFQYSLQMIDVVTGEDEWVFLNAWNEWGEGCYLEPDTIGQYQYLEVIKKILEKRGDGGRENPVK